jgi:hypothetical protein
MTAAGLTERCDVIVGDMFTAVPEGGDLYLMRDILHDWSDDRCVDLLSVCREAMPVGAALMVIERIPSGSDDRQTALMDLYMLSVLTGQERTLDQYSDLLTQAKLRLVSAHRLEAGATVVTAEAI